MANILCVMLLQMNWIQSFTMCSVPYIPNVVERQLENMCKDFFFRWKQKMTVQKYNEYHEIKDTILPIYNIWKPFVIYVCAKLGL